jgi:hypothetical protein
VIDFMNENPSTWYVLFLSLVSSIHGSFFPFSDLFQFQFIMSTFMYVISFMHMVNCSFLLNFIHEYLTYNWCSTKNNSKKVWLKKQLLIFVKIVENQIPNLSKNIIETIWLLLQIHNKKCTLCICSSTFPILKS